MKADMRTQGADVAIIVTQAYPKDFKCFGEMDGIWICSFGEVIALTTAMRHTIIRIAEARRGEETRVKKCSCCTTTLPATNSACRWKQ
jgi:hypothetical protein